VARRIWTEAGRQLALTAVAAAAGLEPVFSWGGRLFDGALALAKAATSVRSHHPYLYVFTRADAPSAQPLRRTR
jgi:hypothetical protein